MLESFGKKLKRRACTSEKRYCNECSYFPIFIVCKFAYLHGPDVHLLQVQEHIFVSFILPILHCILVEK